MSFCRFSSDDFQCDFYAYESNSGYELYVAARRAEWDPPLSPFTPEAIQLPFSEWKQAHEDYFKKLREAPRLEIRHPAAGSHQIFPSLQALRDRIAELASEGLRAPEWLIPELDAEITEQEKPTQ